MSDIAFLRPQAGRCRRLAQHASDDVKVTLVGMAQDYELRSEALEASVGPAPGPIPRR